MNYIPYYIFVNENDATVSPYSDVCEYMITAAEIETTNEHLEREDNRVQPIKGDTIIINLGTKIDKIKIKIGVELNDDENI